MTTEEAIAELLVRGVDDWVMFDEVANLLRLPGELESSERFIAQVRELLSTMLTEDLVRVGSVERGTGFVPWDLPIAEAIDRVIHEWQALPRPPSLGDVCWFENTETGDEIGRRRLSAWRAAQDRSSGPTA